MHALWRAVRYVPTVQRITQPLFRIDPGWLFLVAGLLLIGASVLVPQEARLHDLRQQLGILERLEDFGERRAQAYAKFIDQVEAGDPSVIRRLAAAQLRIVDDGFERLAEADSARAPVSEWIDASVPIPPVEAMAPTDTLLHRWTKGRHQFWLGGLGAFSAFVGLIVGVEHPGRRRRRPVGSGLSGMETTETPTPAAITRPDEAVDEFADYRHGAD